MDLETNLTESAEIQEVAEPVVEEVSSEETPEVAEQVSQKTEADAAFAEMRRQNADLQRQLNEMAKSKDEAENALGLYFQGENKIAQAIAHYEEKPLEQVEKELAAQQETERLKAELEGYREQAIASQAELKMAADLAELQRLKPEIKSIEEMGQEFLNMRLKGGLSVEEAYFATQAMKQAKERVATELPGAVKTETQEKDFFTKAEVAAHQDDRNWIKQNFEIIEKSMKKW